MTTKKWKDQDQVKLDKAKDDLTALEIQKSDVMTELQSEIIAAGIMRSGYTQADLDATADTLINHKTKLMQILQGLD